MTHTAVTRHNYFYICDMNESVNHIIESKINRFKPGQVFLPSDFKELGTSTAIRKALSRLVEAGQIERMGQGFMSYQKMIRFLEKYSHPWSS